MQSIQDKILLSQLTSVEYGQALFRWVQAELKVLEDKEESGLKISDDPLSEDFRTQLGMKIMCRRLLRLPAECTKQLEKGEVR